MRCGEKCFQVKIDLGGERKITSVNARTPVEARKMARKEYGKEIEIISALRKNRR